MKYICETCGYEYDPAVGDHDKHILPGTAFEDLPDDGVCPICGVDKELFHPEEETKNGLRDGEFDTLWSILSLRLLPYSISPFHKRIFEKCIKFSVQRIQQASAH